MALALILAGVWLFGGSLYQIAYGRWFPVFAVQIDALFFVCELLIGRGAALYACSFIAGLVGVVALGLGCALLKRRLSRNFIRPPSGNSRPR